MKTLSNLFNTVFTDIDNLNLKEYIKLINNKSSITEYQTIHKHHIIPRCWYTKNNIEIDNSSQNIVDLNLKDHIIAHVLMARYFYDVNDIEMSNNMIGAVNLLLNNIECPNVLSQEFLSFLDNAKLTRHRKYSDLLVEQMFDEYSKYEDTKEGYKAVKNKFNFKYSHDQLYDIFKERISQDKIQNHKIRTDRYWRSKLNKERLMYKGGKNIRSEGNKLIDSNDSKKLRPIIDECNLYGEEHVKFKYQFYSMYNFFRKCKRLGVLTDEECVKYKVDNDQNERYRSMKYGIVIINEMIKMFKYTEDKLITKEVLYKIALKFNIENPENIRTLLCRWMGYDDYKKILDIRKQYKKSKKMEEYNFKRKQDVKQTQEMYDFYLMNGAKDFKKKYNMSQTSGFLRKCRKIGIMTQTIREGRTSKEISYKGKVQSLNKWLIELNLDGKRHTIIRKHNEDGMSYTDIFNGYLNQNT